MQGFIFLKFSSQVPHKKIAILKLDFCITGSPFPASFSLITSREKRGKERKRSSVKKKKETKNQGQYYSFRIMLQVEVGREEQKSLYFLPLDFLDWPSTKCQALKLMWKRKCSSKHLRSFFLREAELVSRGGPRHNETMKGCKRCKSDSTRAGPLKGNVSPHQTPASRVQLLSTPCFWSVSGANNQALNNIQLTCQ